MSSSKPGLFSESVATFIFCSVFECTSAGGGYAFWPLDLNFDLPSFTHIPAGDNFQLPSPAGDSGCSFQTERKAEVTASEEESTCPVLKLCAGALLRQSTKHGKVLCLKSHGPEMGVWGSSLCTHNVKLPLQLGIKL